MQNKYNNHQQHTTHVRWKIFTLLFLLVVINLIDRISLSIGMSTIVKEFNLSVAMQGVILSSFFWPYTLLQIPTGWLIDKFGSRKIITVSTLLWGIFQTLAAITTNGLSLLISRVILSGAEAPLFPAGAKLNSIWLASAERGRGAVIMDCGGSLGAALGGLIIAQLIILLGSSRWVFAIAGATTIILSFIAWYYLRDNPQQHPAINEAEIAKIHCRNLTKSTKTLTPSNQRSDITSHTLTAILAGRAVWAMIFFGLLTWTPTYLAQGDGLFSQCRKHSSKISGLGQTNETWTVDNNRWIITETIAMFGSERCMFANNFPVDSLCVRPGNLWHGFKIIVNHLPESVQAALFFTNAQRIYAIDPASISYNEVTLSG